MMFAHLPSSYIAINLTESLWQRGLSERERRVVYVIGIAAGMFPDTDGLFMPIREHRASLLHTPFLWFVVCGAIASLALVFPCRRALLLNLALVVLIGTWLHLLLDAIFVGVKLLYPFSMNYYRFRPPISLRYDNWIVNYVLHPIFLTEIYTFIAAGITFKVKRDSVSLNRPLAILRSSRYLIAVAILITLAYVLNWYVIYPLTLSA